MTDYKQKLENDIKDLLRHNLQHDSREVSPGVVGISQLMWVDVVGIISDYLQLHPDFNPRSKDDRPSIQ